MKGSTSKDAFERAAVRHSQRAIEYGVENTLNADEIRRQHDKQGGLCFWCNQPVIAGGRGVLCMVVDHLISMVKGGTNTAGNVVISCNLCNRRKNTVDAAQWARRIKHPYADQFPVKTEAQIKWEKHLAHVERNRLDKPGSVEG